MKTQFILRNCRYADILAGKLQQKVIAIEKIRAARKTLRAKMEQFKQEKASIEPLIQKLTDQTIQLQEKVWLFQVMTVFQFLSHILNDFCITLLMVMI